MPTNKKEGMLFTTLMCFLMVFGMSTYNLLLHGEFSLYALSKGLLPGFIVAFILDVFIVGVLAKKIAFSLPFNKEKRLLLILTISSLHDYRHGDLYVFIWLINGRPDVVTKCVFPSLGPELYCCPSLSIADCRSLFTYDLNQLPTTTNLENRFLI